MFKRDTGSFRDAEERFFRNMRGYAGFPQDQLVNVAQKRAAARYHNAFVHNVGGKLRRRIVEHGFNRADNFVQIVRDGRSHLRGMDVEYSINFVALVSIVVDLKVRIK